LPAAVGCAPWLRSPNTATSAQQSSGEDREVIVQRTHGVRSHLRVLYEGWVHSEEARLSRREWRFVVPLAARLCGRTYKPCTRGMPLRRTVDSRMHRRRRGALVPYAALALLPCLLD
jgi:hypothetical protein